MSGKNPKHYTRETREQWGAAPPRARRFVPRELRRGMAIHYPGTGAFAHRSHDEHRAVARAWQAMHMASGVSNDMEYGALLCSHLVIMEVRTELNRPGCRVGSNGTVGANTSHSSLQFMRGAGDPPPPEDELVAAAEYLTWMRAKGWGPLIDPHRAFVPTACPGEHILAALPKIRDLVDRMEDGKDPRPPSRPDGPYVALKRIRRMARRADWASKPGPKSREQIALVTGALEARGMRDYKRWQEALGFTGRDADGIPGLESLEALAEGQGWEVFDNT